MQWWEKEPLRIIEITSAFNLRSKSVEEEIKLIKELGGNATHFMCMEVEQHGEGYNGGFGDEGFYFKTKLSSKKNPDRLKKGIEIAHKEGIKIIVYFNVHHYNRKFGEKHKDWVQIKEDGEPLNDIYQTSTSFCINSPYREWVFQILKDLCKYQIDGIFYDGPIFFPNTCYCKYCEELFYKEFGEEIPKKSDRNNPLWKKLIEFQTESIKRFLKDSKDLVKSINKEILLYINGNTLSPYWPTGRDNLKIIEETDILGAEGGFFFGDLNLTPIFKPGMTAKYLSSQSKGNPVIIFNASEHKPWRFHLPAGEINFLLAETIANGGNYWISLNPEVKITNEVKKTISFYSKLIEGNPTPFYKTESLSEIALLWPSKTAEVYAGSTVPLTDFTPEIKGENIGNMREEFLGFYDMLFKLQILFDVIVEENFKDLEKYKLIILPNAACLSEENLNKIKEFVRKGGNLIATFETTLYDENGERLSGFGLEEVFGVKFLNKIFGPMKWDYLYFDGNFIPSPEYGIRVEAKNSSINFCEKLKGRYDKFPPEITSLPFLVENKYEKGKCFYFAGTFGATFYKYGFQEYLNIFKDIINSICDIPVKLNFPKIEVNLRKKRSLKFIYLVNFNTDIKRPYKNIYPIKNVEIKVKNLNFMDAEALVLKKKLKFQKEGEESIIYLPILKNFEVIVLK